MKDVIVYTCITNQKDALQLVQREPGVRFVCFSDVKFSHPVWEYMPADSHGLINPRKVARMYKVLSHIWFPDSTTIWIDGRVKLLRPVEYYLNTYKGLICARPHPSRTSIAQEAKEVIRVNYDDPVTVNNHLAMLKPFPDNVLHETGMLIRRPGNKVDRFNNAWWSLITAGSARDQLSFDYVAHAEGINITNVNRNEVQVLRHKKATNATF